MNTVRLGYKSGSVNAIRGNNFRLFLDTYKTRKYTGWAEHRIFKY